MSGYYRPHPVTGAPIWIESGHVTLEQMLDSYLESRRQRSLYPLGVAQLAAVDCIAGKALDHLALDLAGLDPDVVLTITMHILGRVGGAITNGLNPDSALDVVGTAVAMWAGKIDRPGAKS